MLVTLPNAGGWGATQAPAAPLVSPPQQPSLENQGSGAPSALRGRVTSGQRTGTTDDGTVSLSSSVWSLSLGFHICQMGVSWA